MQHSLRQHFQQLRTQLFQTELQLQGANPGTAAWDDAVENMQQVLKACVDCTAFSENNLYPLASRYEPALIDLLNQMQRGIMAQHLAVCINSFPNGEATQSIKVDAEKTRDAFDALVLAHMQYLVRLQDHLLPVLERYYTTETLQQMASKCQAGQSRNDALIKSETAFRGQIYAAEMERSKAAPGSFTHQQALAMHY